MQGDLPGHTPKETERSFTDLGFVPVFAVCFGSWALVKGELV